MISAGLNGLGRFGQHFLYAWLKSPGAISIDYACDDSLSAEAICALLIEHDRLDFSQAMPQVIDGDLYLTRADKLRQKIVFYHGPASHSTWMGLPDVWLECSGKYANSRDSCIFVVGNTRQVIVSATCWDADQTLVMGFNHETWDEDAELVSYGSCTVNAFVPLANWLHENYEILEAEVSIIHSVPARCHLENPHPERRVCTLKNMAPRLLPWLKPSLFFVNYTLIPYSGASLIDLRFRIGRPTSHILLIEALRHGSLRTRYELFEKDPGLASVIGTPSNVVFFEDGITIEGNTLRLSGYFDNENSAVRYLDLLRWIATANTWHSP